MNSYRLEFLVDSLDLERATGMPGIRWEHFQIEHLNDDSVFRIENKARQIAWSWLAAAEAVAEAILEGRDSVFVSINQREAAEKIRYAHEVIECLRPDWRPALTRDNDMELELANSARLTSLPARPPRGRARANVYLDEFAHTPQDRAIYTAALPVLSKGGRLRIGSSPMGASGVFWEIFTQTLRQYPGYKRKQTPWWETWAFCTDVRQALSAAPLLSTGERVQRFGNSRIQAIQANMPDEDFRQEYECEFVDESTAWITWEEIQGVQDAELVCVMAEGKGKAIDGVLAAIERAETLVPAGRIERVLYGGMDIGRTRNTTEIYLVGASALSSWPMRLALTLNQVDFDDQMDVLARMMALLPVQKLLIDRTGIGRNLAETASKRFPGKVEGVDFTNQSKQGWATDAKMLIQQRRTPLPADRDLAYQIHSIKRLITPTKNLVFDTETSQKHHADKFWAWVLALAAGRMHRAGNGVSVYEYATPGAEAEDYVERIRRRLRGENEYGDD